MVLDILEAIISALVLTASGFALALLAAILFRAAAGFSPGYGLFAGMCISPLIDWGKLRIVFKTAKPKK
jgi:hypothetical protein